MGNETQRRDARHFRDPVRPGAGRVHHHAGGDLSRGSIKDDTLACPFHDWRWGGDGKCKAIPYAKRVPLRARTRTWPTMIENDQLFIWHDVENSKPPAELDIPKIDGDVDGPEWSNWVWNEIIIEGSNCREIVDNNVDMAHFFYIHGSLPTHFKNIFEGLTATQFLNTRNLPDKDPTGGKYGETLLESVAAYYGPSYMINPLTNFYGDFKSESILINCHYPVTQNSFVLMYGLKVRKPEDYFAGIKDVAVDWEDSRAHVIAVIDGMREALGSRFPDDDNVRIRDAVMVIEGEPGPAGSESPTLSMSAKSFGQQQLDVVRAALQSPAAAEATATPAAPATSEAPATPGMWRRGLWSTWGADGLEPTAEVDPSFWAVTMKRRNSKEGSTC